jgi:mono/diheme cytochrome c family protein
MRPAFARALARAAMLAALAACGEEQKPLVLVSPAGPVPAEPQRPGSAEAGYDALVNRGYVSCGIPYSAYKQVAAPAPPSRRLPGRSGRNAELPYNLTSHVTERGVEVVAPNCLTCHAAQFNGRLIVGLGDESADFTRDPSLAVESAGTRVTSEPEAAEWRKFADRMKAIAPYVMTDTVGVNPAVNLTWALFAHRDPKTLAWSPKPLLEPPPRQPLPVSVPPWWRMGKKTAMFYTAAGRGDHARMMILASALCTDNVEDARAIDSYAPDIRAYLASIKPPKYPFAIDAALAGRGRAPFERNCASCHGTYGENAAYPNLVLAAETIGTDPLLARTATDGSEERFLRWAQRSFYGENARLAPAPGYYAPPLDAVWATAPYLHNGSVPTLEALLDSAKRPKYWVRSFDSRDYNPRSLGWNYRELPSGKDAEKDPALRSRIYDTTLPGYSNQGHTFGDGLSADERAAILEYLKTL